MYPLETIRSKNAQASPEDFVANARPSKWDLKDRKKELRDKYISDTIDIDIQLLELRLIQLREKQLVIRQKAIGYV